MMTVRPIVFLCVLVYAAFANDDSPRLRRVSVNGRLQDGGLVGQVRANVNYELTKGANPNITKRWFNQKLDHFDPNNKATWLQFYWQNTGNYKPGGPIFLLIGGEAPTSQDWIDDCEQTLHRSSLSFVLPSCFSQYSNDLSQVSERLWRDGLPAGTPLLRSELCYRVRQQTYLRLNFF